MICSKRLQSYRRHKALNVFALVLVDGTSALILLAARSAFFCVFIPCAELPALTDRGREGARPRVDCLLYDLRTTIQIEATARGEGEREGAHVMGMGRSCGVRVVRWPINKALMTIANAKSKRPNPVPCRAAPYTWWQ